MKAEKSERDIDTIINVTCSTCSKTFSKNFHSQQDLDEAEKNEHTCYDCTLERLTNGQCPEVGDFNSASIISGEMTDDERRWLQEDLRSVEAGSGSRYEEDDEEDNRCFHCDSFPCCCNEDR